jgi:hypothetical protein
MSGEAKILTEELVVISEGRSQTITIEQATELFKKHCNDFDFDNHFMYRGVRFNSDYALFDAKGSKPRKSAYTENYYTHIIDNHKGFKQYPKRSRSLIASTSIQKAMLYGDEVYRIIPFDGAKIGICPDSDIWDSFEVLKKYHIRNLDVFNKEFERLIYGALDSFASKMGTWPQIEKDAKKINKEFLGNLDLDMSDFSDEEYLLWYPIQNGKFKNLAELIEHAFDPSSNKFKLTTIENFKDVSNREVWTDSKCLLVRQSEFGNFEDSVF